MDKRWYAVVAAMAMGAMAFAVPKTHDNLFALAFNAKVADRAGIADKALKRANEWCKNYHHGVCPKIRIVNGLTTKDGYSRIMTGTAAAFDHGEVASHELWYVDNVKIVSLSGDIAVLQDDDGNTFGVYMDREMYDKAKKKGMFTSGGNFDCAVFQDGANNVVVDVFTSAFGEYMANTVLPQEDFDEMVSLIDEQLQLLGKPRFKEYEN